MWPGNNRDGTFSHYIKVKERKCYKILINLNPETIALQNESLTLQEDMSLTQVPFLPQRE